MNKTILYAVVFLALAGLAAFVLMGRGSNTIGGSNSDFKLENPEKVERIFIGDRDNNTVNLTRQSNGTWLVNDKYEARQAAIDLLFETATKIGVRDIVADAAVPTVYREFQEKGVFVRFYDKKGKVIKAYQMGDKTSEGLGTNVMMEGAKQPFIVHVPIWEGFLTPRFMTAEKDWRDRAVFKMDPDNIESVSVEYQNQRMHSFTLTKKGSEFSIEPFYNTTPKINKPVNQAAAQQYFTKFADIKAEAIKTGDFPLKSVIGEKIPFSVIRIKQKDGTEQRVDFYPIPNSNVGEESISPSMPNGVPERYFAVDDKEMYLVQHRLFMVVFSAYSGFF